MLLYWLCIGLGALLSGAAMLYTRSTFHKYSRLGTRSGMTGADVARRILADNGISDVTVERVAGALTDHYDPSTKTLRLSEPVYGERSMSALGVAAHEVGHAIQHAQGYAPLQFRSAWVPVANLGGGISMVLLMIGLAIGATGIATLGVVAFAATTVFTLVTLPVEFDASRRAMLALEGGGYMAPEELSGSRSVLTAAGLTYVAAFLASLIQLVYFAWAAGLLGGHDE